MKRQITYGARVALAFEGAAVPEWIELLPAGPEITGRDGRVFRLGDPAAVVAAFDADNQPIVVDIEHASETAEPGTPVPAQGWVEALEVRDGAVWGRVDWTGPGAELLGAQAYRYISPAFFFDPDSREIVALKSVGLVHRPNFDLTALNFQDEETETMDKAIREALGLAADATAADAVVAINKLKEDRATALNAAQPPDPERFVPKADHELALNRISEFEAAEAERRDADMQAAVDEAVREGRIAPASKDYHLATCRVIGIDKFREMMAGQPPIASARASRQPTDEGGVETLGAEDIAVCAVLGIDRKKFAETRAQQETK